MELGNVNPICSFKFTLKSGQELRKCLSECLARLTELKLLDGGMGTSQQGELFTQHMDKWVRLFIFFAMKISPVFYVFVNLL